MQMSYYYNDIKIKTILTEQETHPSAHLMHVNDKYDFYIPGPTIVYILINIHKYANELY